MSNERELIKENLYLVVTAKKSFNTLNLLAR